MQLHFKHEIFSVPQSDNEYIDDTAIEFYIYSEADNIVIKNNRIDVLKFIEKLISRVIEEDQSYPVTYHLRQLRNRNYVPLQNDMSTKIAQIYETIDKNRNFKEGIKLQKYPVKIHEKTHEFPINSEVTWDKTLEDINDKLLNQRNHILKLRNTIICERNNPNPDTISKINGFYEKNEEICHDIHTMLQDLFKISIWSQEAPYVGVGDNLDVLVQKDSPFYSSYIFFCSLENRSNQLDENMSLFNNLLNLKQKPCIYVDIDAKCKELFPQHSFKKEIGQNFYDGLIKLGFKGETKICIVERGQITVPDLLDSLRNDSFAQGFNFEKSFEKPDEEVLLSYACPKANSGKCVGRTHYWKCIACEELFKIGYYGYLYCKCGQVSSKELRFKCGDPSHGSKFLLCYNDNFDDYLAREQPRKELAILVLGGSGVGKSTWINAIANYLRFSSLQEAMESPTICLIHSKFEMTVLENGKLRRRTIEIKPSSNSEFDSDSNETLEDAKSATKHPRVYEFYWKHYKVHIIDTPGMSDTNGLEQDKRNSQKILNAISTYKEIHGICLLFKSNENRLDTSFRYCLSEILLQLHRSALQNMVFFFTYARTSFYRPGDILTTLTTFINDLKETQKLDISLDMYSNVYCIDNESFRFLCAHKSGEEFHENEIESYSDSWKKSTIETLRFLDNITKIPGHRVDMTISLNQARLIILKMTRPLAQISDLIQTNIKISNDYNKELENCELEINKLAAKQKIMTVGYESNKLPYARTVCTSPKCSTIERIPNSDQTTTVYKQICHPHCTLKNIELLQYPQPDLKKCRAMKKTFVSLSGEICQVCGCGWQEHLHIDFEQRKVLFPTEDQTVKKAIANKEDVKTLKQKMIKECNDRIKQYNKEQAKITGKKSKLYIRLFLVLRPATSSVVTS